MESIRTHRGCSASLLALNGEQAAPAPFPRLSRDPPLRSAGSRPKRRRAQAVAPQLRAPEVQLLTSSDSSEFWPAMWVHLSSLSAFGLSVLCSCLCQEIACPSGTFQALHQMSYHYFLFDVVECVSMLYLMFQEKHLEKEKIKQSIEMANRGREVWHGLSRQSRLNRGCVSWYLNHCYLVAWLSRILLCVWEQVLSEIVFCSWFLHHCSRFTPSLQISFILIVIVVFILFLFVVLWMCIMAPNLPGMRQGNINRAHNWNHMQLRLILSPQKIRT